MQLLKMEISREMTSRQADFFISAIQLMLKTFELNFTQIGGS